MFKTLFIMLKTLIFEHFGRKKVEILVKQFALQGFFLLTRKFLYTVYFLQGKLHFKIKSEYW